MSDETYYSVLEISETATAAEIKGAYYRLIREVHPDRLANAPAYWQKQAEEKTKEINEAFAVLSSREKRRLYDAQLDSYRKFQNPNGATQAAPSSNPQSTTSSQQRTRQSTSGGNSASSYQSATRQQSPSASTSPTKSTSQPVSPPIGGFQRFLIAAIFAISGCGAASGFWNSSTGDEIIMFLLAIVLFGGIAYLYRRRIRPLWIRLRLSRPKQQAWVTIGAIALALLVGNTAYMKPGDIVPDILLLSVIVLLGFAYSYRKQIRLLFIRGGLGRLKYQIMMVLIAGLATLVGTLLHSNISATAPQTGVSAAQGSSGSPTSSSFESKVSIASPSPHSDGDDWFAKFGGKEVTPPRIPAKQARSHDHNREASYVPRPESNVAGKIEQPGKTTGMSPLSGSNNQLRLNPSHMNSTKAIDNRTSVQASYTASQSGESNQEPITNKLPDLSTLSISDRGSIQTACSLAYGQGPASYHRCLNLHLAELTVSPKSPDLSGLSISDRGSIQTACSLEYGQGPVSYHRCLDRQLAELAASPKSPDLSGLSISDRGSIQTACSLAYGQGLVSYHRCLSRQLAELAASPKSPDLSGLSISDRGSIQTACSLAYGQGPASYHRCLLRQLASLRNQ